MGLDLFHLCFLNAKLGMSFLNLGTADTGMERFFAGGGGRRGRCGLFSSTLGLSPPRMPGAASFPSSDEQKRSPGGTGHPGAEAVSPGGEALP